MDIIQQRIRVRQDGIQTVFCPRAISHKERGPE